MKIGVDAVLLGAWADISNSKNILDVGCGCGVISLMLAQRTNDAIITGIDIDKLSIEESICNANNTLWTDRLRFELADFMILKNRNYDHIVSNPPYFDDGVDDLSTFRLKARHIEENGLSPISLITVGVKILSSRGKISLICPIKWKDDLLSEADRCGLFLNRLTYIKGNSDAPIKRMLIEFAKIKYDYKETTMVLEKERGVSTDEYRDLTKDFYLKF